MTPSLDRGVTQVFLIREGLLGDSLPVSQNDLAAKGFGGSLPRQKARESLVEISVAGKTPELANF
jgi:hypothetical protein